MDLEAYSPARLLRSEAYAGAAAFHPRVWLLHEWSLLLLYPTLCSLCLAVFSCSELQMGIPPVHFLKFDL